MIYVWWHFLCFTVAHLPWGRPGIPWHVPGWDCSCYTCPHGRRMSPWVCIQLHVRYRISNRITNLPNLWTSHRIQSILPMHHECKTYLQDSRVTQDSSGKACSPWNAEKARTFSVSTAQRRCHLASAPTITWGKCSGIIFWSLPRLVNWSCQHGEYCERVGQTDRGSMWQKKTKQLWWHRHW